MTEKTVKVKKLEAEAFGIIATLSAIAIQGVTTQDQAIFVKAKAARLKALMNQIQMLEA